MNTEKVIKRDQKYTAHTHARVRWQADTHEGMWRLYGRGQAYLTLLRIGVNALGYTPGFGVQMPPCRPTSAFFQPVLHRPLRQAGQAAVCPHRA